MTISQTTRGLQSQQTDAPHLVGSSLRCSCSFLEDVTMVDFRVRVSLPLFLGTLSMLMGSARPFSVAPVLSSIAKGLTSNQMRRQPPSPLHRLPSLHGSKDRSSEKSPESPTRRQLLTTLVAAGAFLLPVLPQQAIAASDIPPSPSAPSSLFRPNPLTNPFLEQVRIWEQAEADELRYGGELERGDAGNRGQVEAYPSLLTPIVTMSDELERVGTLVERGNRPDDYREARQILSDSKYEKIAFKKTFNRYGDNIYYADPDRANLYLGGGATPKTEQSLAYLLRNDILTNVEALQAELDYLLAHPEDGSTEDLQSYSKLATQAMRNYLDLVPPRELAQARALLTDAAGSTSNP